MTRTPLRDRPFPPYTRGEDIANMITHIIGGGIGVVVLVISVLVAAFNHNVWGVVGSSIYGASMILLYSVSSVYHGLRPCYGKKVMQVIDHCTIYLLIAGTYTPVLLSAIRPDYPVIAWTIFGIEWGLVAVAAVFTAIDHNRFKHLSMICYIGLGWCIVFALRPTIECIGWPAFWWLISGGVAYTVGAVLYGIGGKKPIFHTIFHIFTDIGSILQAICIIFYVL
ncbi:MAG: hemolysin III family protein [Clostridia bacterium]|nr:hemolysin III family protein [Clostridia bacterium]